MLKNNVLRTGLSWLYKILFVIQSVCMYASVVTIVLTVLLRELFHISLVWGYEIACWFVIILVFTAMPWNLYKKSNLSVTMLYDISSKPVRKVLDVVHYIVELVVLIMVVVGFRIWITSVGNGKMTASGMSNTMYYGVVGVGVFLSLIEMACEVIDLFVEKKPEDVAETKHEETVLEMLEEEKEQAEVQKKAETDKISSDNEKQKGLQSKEDGGKS